MFQRGVAGEIDYLICHGLVLLDDKIQAAIRFIECGLYLTVFDSDDAPVVFCRVCHQLLGSRVDVVGMVGVGRLGNLPILAASSFELMRTIPVSLRDCKNL